MSIITNMEEKIRGMGLKEAYNFITSHQDLPSNIHEQVRFGFLQPRIDIYDYLNSTLLMKGKTGEVVYRGHAFTLEVVYTDMEKRQKIMKEWLIDKYKRTTITMSR